MKKFNLLLSCLLSLLLVLSLTSCSSEKEVENEAISINVNDTEIAGSYTGVLTKGAPSGEGILTIDSDGGSWKYQGAFAEGVPSDGKVTDMPIILNVNDTEYNGHYTGDTNTLIPNGTGEFVDKSNNFTYKGSFENSQPKDGTVTNIPLVFTLNNVEYSGTYSGEVSSFIPNGNGSFSDGASDFVYTGDFDKGISLEKGICESLSFELSAFETTFLGLYSGDTLDGIPQGNGIFEYSEDNSYLSYEGGFDSGIFSGTGNLSTNEYIVYFIDGVVRKGEFDGNVIDGVANGQGEFTATNDIGTTYKMSGEWKDGLLNGEGKREFLNDNYVDLIGNFVNGEFSPSLIEAVNYLTEYEPSFSISSVNSSFLIDNTDLFINHSSENLSDLIDSAFTYASFAKDVRNHEGKLFSIDNLIVVQTLVIDEFADYNVVFYLLTDSTFSEYYYVYIFNDNAEIYAQDTVNLCALPLSSTVFDDTLGGQTWCAICIGAVITKQ